MKYFRNPICDEIIDSFVAKLATEVVEDMISTEKATGWYHQLDELVRQNWWESCGTIDVCFDSVIYNKATDTYSYEYRVCVKDTPVDFASEMWRLGF